MKLQEITESFKYQLEGRILNDRRPMEERIKALQDLLGKHNLTAEDVEKYVAHKRERFHHEELRNRSRAN